MRQKRFLAISILTWTLLSATWALGQQPNPTIDPLDKRMATFFEATKSKNFQAAYQGLLGDKPPGTPDDLKKLEDKTAQIETNYGTYREFERVYTKQVGTDLVFMKYLYKCSKFPVLWHVTFYRTSVSGELGPASPTWQVVSIRFDTDLDVLTLLKE